MYVCLCNGYRDSDLRRVAHAGAGDVVAVYQALGAGPCCGQCLDMAQDIVDQTRRPAGIIAAE